MEKLNSEKKIKMASPQLKNIKIKLNESVNDNGTCSGSSSSSNDDCINMTKSSSTSFHNVKEKTNLLSTSLSKPTAFDHNNLKQFSGQIKLSSAQPATISSTIDEEIILTSSNKFIDYRGLLL